MAQPENITPPKPDYPQAASDPELSQLLKILAHDLSAPVRHLRYFSERLYESLGDARNEQQDESEYYIDLSLKRIDGLIDAIARYGVLVNGFSTRPDVSCDEIFSHLYSKVKPLLDEADVTLELPRLSATLTGDKDQLVEMLVYLVENSLRFASDDRPLEITLAAEVDKGSTVFQVIDNGVGIDPTQYDHVLQMFRHGERDRAGVGAGLGLVSRIVKNHGGLISLTAAKPVGLCVTIRIAQQ